MLMIQHNSFFQFIIYEVEEELYKQRHLWLDSHCELLICSDSLRYIRLLYRYPDRIKWKKTHEVYLFIPIVFYNFKNNDLFARWVKLGHIPLLTRQGHFLSDGVSYAWVTQIVRKPGVYLFNKSKRKKTKKINLIICPIKGKIIHLKKEQNNIWFYIKNNPPILLKNVLLRMSSALKC